MSVYKFFLIILILLLFYILQNNKTNIENFGNSNIYDYSIFKNNLKNYPKKKIYFNFYFWSYT